jgi:replicative DNA helicase
LIPNKLDKAQLQHFLEVEQQIIHLMLKDRRAIDEMVQAGFSSDLFDENHRLLVSSIYSEFLQGNRLLTADGYRQILITNGYKGNVPLMMEVFAKCDIKAFAELDDLGHLKRKLVDAYVARKANDSLHKFLQNVEQKGYFAAASDFADQLQQALSLANLNRTSFTPLDEYKGEYISILKNLATNPEQIIRCGVPEIDDAMTVGYRAGHLTLFVADVGGHKTNIMLNIALNICDQGHNVLFIPLEMSKQDLTDRIISNRTGVNYVKFSRPDMLDKDDWSKIESASVWDKPGAKKGTFCILDADERSTVSQIRREIEKRAFLFKPKVVVIDYVAIMKSDNEQQRNDLQIGEILKTLRFLGKKHGFHIVSAAQMGRAAIRALKEDSDSVPDSTSIRGSHEYSADADTIFALMKPPTGETNRIKIYTLKARRGKAGEVSELSVDASCCRISSMKNTLTQVTDVDKELATPVETIADGLQKLSKANVKFAAGFDLDTGSEEHDDLMDLN